MRQNERPHVAVPASQQNRRSPIIRLRQAESPIFLGDFDSECADLGQAFEIFRRNQSPQEIRSEEHTSELQSHLNLVCRLLLEKKKQIRHTTTSTDRKQIPATLNKICT